MATFWLKRNLYIYLPFKWKVIWPYMSTLWIKIKQTIYVYLLIENETCHVCQTFDLKVNRVYTNRFINSLWHLLHKIYIRQSMTQQLLMYRYSSIPQTVQHIFFTTSEFISEIYECLKKISVHDLAFRWTWTLISCTRNELVTVVPILKTYGSRNV